MTIDIEDKRYLLRKLRNIKFHAERLEAEINADPHFDHVTRKTNYFCEVTAGRIRHLESKAAEIKKEMENDERR